MRTPFTGQAGNPLAEMVRMQREMDRLFQAVDPRSRNRVFPPINIYEGEDAFLLRAELPGVSADDLDITTRRHELILSGRRNAPDLGEGGSCRRRERTFGRFNRTFTLPDTIDSERIDATYHDGVLQLRMPKRAETAPRQIAVTTG